MDSITVKKIRTIFFDKNTGLPKKECLKDIIDLCKILKINIDSMNPPERSYTINLLNAYIKAIRDICREHHINWLDIKLNGMKYVKHGFSQNPELIENNLLRVKTRMIQHKEIYKQVKEIINKQLELF
ncbi:MAG TPA: hypothetical protein VGB37_04550 [Candidatus Lokiarchaeia archaeon]